MFLSEWDTLVIMAPFAALMILAMFGLDDRLGRRAPARSRSGSRRFCEVHPGREPVLRDPDGKIWRSTAG